MLGEPIVLLVKLPHIGESRMCGGKEAGFIQPNSLTTLNYCLMQRQWNKSKGFVRKLKIFWLDKIELIRLFLSFFWNLLGSRVTPYKYAKFQLDPICLSPSSSLTDKRPATTNNPNESNLNLLKLGLVWAELSKYSLHLFPSARAWRQEPWRGPWPWASTYSYTLHCLPAWFHWTFSFLTFWISRSLNTGFPDSRPYTGFPRTGIFTRPCVYWLAVVCQGQVGEVLSSAHLSQAIAGPLT